MSVSNATGLVQIESLPWHAWAQGIRFAGRYRVLSDTRNDARKIGIAYEELPPGKQSCPFHYHLLEEEHIIALEGEATLRLGEERLAIRAGDYVCFPAGLRVAHCLLNETEQPFRFLIVGDRQPSEVCVYPDSNKVMVRQLEQAIFQDGQRVDYWQGEPVDEPLPLRNV